MVAKLIEKGQDYSDGEWTENFRSTAEHFGIPQYEACDFLEVLKLSRLRSMRRRPSTGESMHDQYLDKANFALLALALLMHHNEIAHPFPPRAPIPPGAIGVSARSALPGSEACARL